MSKPNTKKLTVKSVAEKLGVSTATVSNAFNRPDQLSKAKRTEILEACKRIGYRGPNRTAQILRKGQSNIIALVLSDSAEYTVSDPVASAFTKGVCTELESEGKHVLLFSGNAPTLLDIADFVDGFICYGAPQNTKIIDELKSVTKPVVTADFTIEGLPSVQISNEQAAYELAKAVVKPDDKVGIIGLRLIDSPVTCRVYDSKLYESECYITRHRLDGYSRALQELGMEVNSDYIWNVPLNNEHYAQQAARELLQCHPRPNIVFCMSDVIALELLRLAISEGLNVPEDIKITGFDGIDEGQRRVKNLTTVTQFSDIKGERAARALMDGSKQPEIIEHKLILGKTS